ncbi:MAG: rhomboid family intramembrane serine protease [Myxococcota bacterium]
MLAGAPILAWLAIDAAARAPWWSESPEHIPAAALVAFGAKLDAWVALGEVHRLATSVLVHRSAGHVAANALWITALAVAALRRTGPAAVFAAWALGGVAGHALGFALRTGPSVGASGSAYALAGLLLVLLWRDRARLGRRARLLAAAFGGAVAATLLLAPALPSRIDHASHAGGLVVGLTLGALVAHRPRRGDLVGVAGALVLLAAAGLAAADPGLPPAPRDLVDVPGFGPDALPAAGRHGHLGEGGCDPEAAGGPACTRSGVEMLAAAGAPADLAAVDDTLAGLVPAPGRCVRYSTPDESVLLVRLDPDRLVAFAALPAAWSRWQGVRAALTAGRCPGR